MSGRKRGNGKNWRAASAIGVTLLGLALAQSQSPAPVVPPAVPSQPAAPDKPAVPTQTPAPAQPEATPDSTDPGAAEEGATVSLTRTAKDGKKRIIRVVRTGNSDQTGVFVACQPLDNDPPGTPTVSVFSETGAGGIRVSIDKNVIVAPLAVVSQKEGGDGHIEVSAGTARALDEVPAGVSDRPEDRLARCAIEAKPSTVPDSVNVTQGKTRLKGSKLIYDDSDGIARIDGPISFSRQNTGSTEAGGTGQGGTLTGSSGTIEVNVDEQTTTLVGNVTLKDGTRTSTAGRVEYDDEANVAILRGSEGSPAKSVTADQTLTASVIRYNLDTGSVVAIGPIGGEFQDGGPESAGGTSVPAAAPAVPGAPVPTTPPVTPAPVVPAPNPTGGS